MTLDLAPFVAIAVMLVVGTNIQTMQAYTSSSGGIINNVSILSFQ